MWLKIINALVLHQSVVRFTMLERIRSAITQHMQSSLKDCLPFFTVALKLVTQ
jgi:hypothetical protein